jgi:hypothetical protein
MTRKEHTEWARQAAAKLNSRWQAPINAVEVEDEPCTHPAIAFDQDEDGYSWWCTVCKVQWFREEDLPN